MGGTAPLGGEKAVRMTSLLIVEDEQSLAESLAFSLTKHGYRVKVASDGSSALKLLEQSTPDLILLDVMLPGIDGFELCRMVQKLETPIPIIMITARSSETDRVVGLELGADDYVIKPFYTRELEARIKAVLRRRRPGAEAMGKPSDLEVDLERQVVRRQGKPIVLSPKEWELLRCLIQEKSIVSKEALLEKVWGSGFDGDPKTVEIHVHWLRQKLEPDPTHPRHIITVKKRGYRFEP